MCPPCLFLLLWKKPSRPCQVGEGRFVRIISVSWGSESANLLYSLEEDKKVKKGTAVVGKGVVNPINWISRNSGASLVVVEAIQDIWIRQAEIDRSIERALTRRAMMAAKHRTLENYSNLGYQASLETFQGSCRIFLYRRSMLHIVAPLRSIIRSYRQPIPPWSIFCGHISTNSAIHQGLRKSSWTRGDPRSNDQDGGRRAHGPKSEFRREPKLQRPNHSHRQDVDDMAESARLREAKRSPKQKHYLQGGRKRNEEPERRVRTNVRYGFHESSGRPSPTSTRGPRDISMRYQTARSAPSTDAAHNAPISRHQKDTFDRYDRSRSRVFQDPRSSSHTQGRGTTALQNRAARRASTFGQNEGSSESHNDDRAALSGARSDTTERWHSDSRLSVGVEEQGLSNRSTPRSRGGNFLGRDRAIDVPVTVPYTTPASEFLYGTSVVSAALKFSQRKFYKLYSYFAQDRANHGQDQAMRNLARSKGVEVMRVEGEWLRLLDKMSTGRPHNVCLLQ